jgi:hypothetical protein
LQKVSITAAILTNVASMQIFLASALTCCKKQKIYQSADGQKKGVNTELIKDGGASQSRTGLNGFAGRGITALLSRHLGDITTYIKNKIKTGKSAYAKIPVF